MPVVKEKVVVVSFLFKPSSLFSFDLHFVAFSSSSCCGGSGAGVEVVVVVADVVLVVVDILEIEPVRTQNTPVPVWYSYQVYIRRFYKDKLRELKILANLDYRR